MKMLMCSVSLSLSLLFSYSIPPYPSILSPFPCCYSLPGLFSLSYSLLQWIYPKLKDRTGSSELSCQVSQVRYITKIITQTIHHHANFILSVMMLSLNHFLLTYTQFRKKPAWDSRLEIFLHNATRSRKFVFELKKCLLFVQLQLRRCPFLKLKPFSSRNFGSFLLCIDPNSPSLPM